MRPSIRYRKKTGIPKTRSWPTSWQYGSLYTAPTGGYTTIAYPGPSQSGTDANGINDLGQVVGMWMLPLASIATAVQPLPAVSFMRPRRRGL